MPSRIHTQELPKGPDAVIALFKTVLGLSGVLKIEITPEEFMVVRSMEDEKGPVVPAQDPGVGEGVDPEFLLQRVVLEEATFVPGQHPYLTYYDVTSTLTHGLLKVCGIIAPAGSMFADFFGLDEVPVFFLGMPVIYHSDAKYDDKFVVLGGPTGYVADATNGVVVDMGV